MYPKSKATNGNSSDGGYHEVSPILEGGAGYTSNGEEQEHYAQKKGGHDEFDNSDDPHLPPAMNL